jgi:hypothetical protein
LIILSHSCGTELDGQNVTGRRTGELVGAVRRADRNRQGIDAGLLHEIGSLFRIGQQLRMIECALGTDAVFFTGLAGFQRSEAAELAFHGHTTGVRHFDRAARDIHVVFIGGRGLAVFLQRAVHHHRGETELDGALADSRRGAVVLVHDHRNVRPLLDGGQDQVAQERRAGVLARTGRGLHDHRAVGFCSRFHDGAHLLEVVDVERRDAVTMLGGVIQYLAQSCKCHAFSPERLVASQS